MILIVGATERAVFCSFKRALNSKVVLTNTFFSTLFVSALFDLCNFCSVATFFQLR